MSQNKLDNLIRETLEELYHRRLKRLSEVRLSDLLKKSNIYLLAINCGENVSKIVQSILQQYITADDEVMLSDTFLKSIAKITNERNEAANYNEPITVMKRIIGELSGTSVKSEEEWGKARNRFVHDFLNNFGNPDGSIHWEKLLRFNSGKDKVVWVTTVATEVIIEDQDEESDNSDDVETEEEE